MEGKFDGHATLNLQLTTKGEVYGHLAQYERNVSVDLRSFEGSECLSCFCGLDLLCQWRHWRRIWSILLYVLSTMWAASAW